MSIRYHVIKVNGKGNSNIIGFLSYILIFALTVVIFGLGVSILSNVRTSASIASEQFMDGGVSLYGIYIGVIVLGSFHFAFQLCLGGFFLRGFMESTSCDSEPGDGFIFILLIASLHNLIQWFLIS